MALTFDQIIGNIKKRIFHPVYVFTGEEPYFIDQLSNAIEKTVLDETEKEFNQTIVYGRDTDVKSVVSMAKRFPMMASHQVLIVKEAQYLDKIEDLVSYVEQPLDSTLLVINYKHKKLDGRTAFVKQVKAKGVFFESKKIYDNKVGPWITEYLGKKGFSITPKASVMLTEFVGADLGKIVNELDKLALNLPAGTTISDKHIEENIGISKDFNIFELQNALGSKNILKANQIARHFAANPKENPLQRTIPMLYIWATRVLTFHELENKSSREVASALSINPFFVKDVQTAARNYNKRKLIRIIGYFREYDMKSKGVDNISANDGELLKELLFKILH